MVEEPAPAPVEEPQSEEPVVEEKAEEPKVEEKPQPQPVSRQRPKIPGSFVVKTNDGYYVEDGKMVPYKEGAKIFGDYYSAVDVKKQIGGKVIKLSDAEPEPVKEQPKVEPKPAPAKEPKEKKAPVKKAAPKPAPVKKPVAEKKPKPAPVKKPAPVVEEKAEEPAPQPVLRPREKIPGRFIVKTHQGYYISENKYSNSKEDAKVFDDFNLAKDIKKEKGGKIVKL